MTRMQHRSRLFSLFLLTFVIGGAFAQQGEGPFRGQPLENVTSGGQPDAAELESLAESGYTTVIDVRRPT